MTQLQKLKPAFEMTLETPITQSEKIDFSKTFLEAIDRAFSIQGKLSKQVVYKHLQTEYGIDKERIPVQAEAFVKAIEKTFGHAAPLIETRIMQTLHRRVPSFTFPVEDRAFSFMSYVEAFRLFCR
jgi:hypothetical protein